MGHEVSNNCYTCPIITDVTKPCYISFYYIQKLDIMAQHCKRKSDRAASGPHLINEAVDAVNKGEMTNSMINTEFSIQYNTIHSKKTIVDKSTTQDCVLCTYNWLARCRLAENI